MNKLQTLLFILTATLLLACNRLPATDFYEVNGIISIEAAVDEQVNNWEKESHYTGKSMVSYRGTESNNGQLSFDFYVSKPGSYSFWILSSRFSPSEEENFLEFYFEDEEGRELQRSTLALPSENTLKWVNKSHTDESEIVVSFPEEGVYTLSFESFGKAGYRVDKIHMNSDYNRKPEGMGLPATRNPRVDPVQAKRDQFIAMPPAWAFGVLFGGDMDQNETIKTIEKLNESDYPIDGYWVDSRFGGDQQPERDFSGYSDLEELWAFLDSLNIKAGVSIGSKIFHDEKGEMLAGLDDLGAAEYFNQKVKPAFDQAVDFLKLTENPSLEFTKIAFETVQEHNKSTESRGFIMTGIHNTHDPRFKKYPANLSRNKFLSDDSDIRCDTMGGLKESIEMGADPRLTTYEIPFLIHDIGGCSLFSSAEISDELFIRWVQFSAFNTMMHLYSHTKNGKLMTPDNFSVVAQNQFMNLAQLRNRLFPYLYSYAHRAYATGVKPVTGDGVGTTQYMLGEAFLVAPIYESGERNRNVHFQPGTWYDYWSGRKYEGGQSWLIDAPLTKIPVFVKAGSIIPYRNYSQTILSGSNDTLTVEVYSGASGTFRLYEDDYETMGYSRAQFATTGFRYFEGESQSVFTIGAIAGRYSDMPIERSWNIEIKYSAEPKLVELNGELLERDTIWEYSSDTQILAIKWKHSVHEKLDFVIQY